MDPRLRGDDEGRVRAEEWRPRRLLVIPAELAYGDTPPSGSGIEKGEALVFVVDMVSSP